MIDCGMDPKRALLAMQPEPKRSKKRNPARMRGVGKPSRQLAARVERLEALLTQLLRLGVVPAAGERRDTWAA